MPTDKFYINENIKLIKKTLGDKLELIGVVLESKAKQEIKSLNAVDTGRLANSITHQTERENLLVDVGTNVEYAPFVELGTHRSQPKPFLRNTLTKNKNIIKQILNK